MRAKVEQNGQGLQVDSSSEKQCVWMKTGIVDFKTCENAFDCPSCAFDKEISRVLSQEKTALTGWREVMRQPHLHKECRHMLTGRVLFKLCSHNYHCHDCAYDQQLYEYGRFLGEENRSAPAAVQVDEAPGLMVVNA